MPYLLDQINSPDDLKRLPAQQLGELCAEIRTELTNTVSRTGGHLASNLGAVELTVALHRVFDCPADTFVFDVGHQCYTHKLLTGRREAFATLRQRGGLSGFPKPSESPYDPFIAGHSSTSLSNAVGLARARKLRGEGGKVIAIIGDGAFSNGLIYEAINSIDKELDNLIVLLNDNSMSISKSVGTISTYLMRLRTGVKYSNFKRVVQKALLGLPLIGDWLTRTILQSKSLLRRQLYGGTLFEELGFYYIGPVDGHNLDDLMRILRNASHIPAPVLIHAITIKGKGFALAEENPGAYHGVGHFDLEEGNPDIAQADSFSNVFGGKLCELADTDDALCAVTAAMKYATGLHYFYKHHKERFFDVGIAEEHAVTFCSGLSRGGMRPVFSVYSTFAQRTFDQIIHDISISGVPVFLAIDRAGLVGDDGETHQGIFDVPMFNAVKAFMVAAPCNYAELLYWTQELAGMDRPRAIRYPRGAEDPRLSAYECSGKPFDLIRSGQKRDCLFITYGRELAEVLQAAQALNDGGVACDVLKLNIILPLDPGALDAAREYRRIVFVEESIVNGGTGEGVMRALVEGGYRGNFSIRGLESNRIAQGTVEEQLREAGLDSGSLAGLFD